MADIGLTENCGDSGYKFEIWFRRRTLGENYILQALNSESKRVWVQDISKLLWRQALKNRGDFKPTCLWRRRWKEDRRV